jgi:hypothetical protein
MSTILRYLRRGSPVAFATALLLASWAAPEDGQAQNRPVGRVNATPERLLADFAVEEQGRSRGPATAGPDIVHVLNNSDKFPAQTVNAILTGLERLALSSPDARVRAGAAAAFTIAGSRRNPRPIPGIAQRMLRMYDRSQDQAVRRVLVSFMGRSAEPQVVIPFVRTLAMQEPHAADFPGAAGHALATLVAMEQGGRPVLQDLHARGLVRDPGARFELNELAKRDFRIR